MSEQMRVLRVLSQERKLSDKLLSLWNNALVRSLIIQFLVFATIVFIFGYFTKNALDNMARAGITSGYDFLGRSANFAIGESLFAYQSADSYGHAILVGLANTVKVSLIGCVLATVLGTLLGIARLSNNPLLNGLVQTYVEIVRNIPLLLQLFFWYVVIISVFPGPREAWSPLGGVFLSNRGVMIPALHVTNGGLWFWALVALIVAVFVLRKVNIRYRVQTGISRPTWSIAAILGLGLPLVLVFGFGERLTVETPALKGFNFVGGNALSPEFAALLAGLTLYTSAFISEIVRSGIESVSKGQREAAYSLALSWGQSMRLVILPQALRVIIPPITSVYMALTKNSSLAVAIGYPDLVSVVNTTMNQTGQAVETIAILMSAYLTLSISISLFMNWYNKHVALKER